MNNTRVIRPVLGLLLCAALCASCGSEMVRQGSGSSYLIVEGMSAASGAKADVFSQVLQSDVSTNGSVFEDLGQVALRLGMKDVMVAPTLNNVITVNRYHVKYIRADGRNAQGVDLPYEFDGAVNGTVLDGSPATFTFVLVRAQAKLEAPLAALKGLHGAEVISTIAEITFYGRDQTGNAVSVTGTISVNFADWADPK